MVDAAANSFDAAASVLGLFKFLTMSSAPLDFPEMSFSYIRKPWRDRSRATASRINVAC